jgi:hypothetical protein
MQDLIGHSSLESKFINNGDSHDRERIESNLLNHQQISSNSCHLVSIPRQGRFVGFLTELALERNVEKLVGSPIMRSHCRLSNPGKSSARLQAIITVLILEARTTKQVP